jgi:hypothetical protein
MDSKGIQKSQGGMKNHTHICMGTTTNRSLNPSTPSAPTILHRRQKVRYESEGGMIGIVSGVPSCLCSMRMLQYYQHMDFCGNCLGNLEACDLGIPYLPCSLRPCGTYDMHGANPGNVTTQCLSICLVLHVSLEVEPCFER